ncbi:MAG TPA: Sip1-related alpha-galactosidase [Prolixibacteraceae bacterium]|nr:Sip1-related alpha-galactosidase [Prolixibacteraceae bacterium]
MKKIEFRSSIRIVCTLTTIIALLFQQTVAAQQKVSTKVSSKGLEIVYRGKTRFTGGKPQIQNKVCSPKSVVAKSNTFTYKFDQSADITTVFTPEGDNIWGMKLSLTTGEKRNGKEFAGFFFDEISGFKTGVEIWRYKPWNSWTKPLRVSSPAELHDWDVQFFYWKYNDGTYGAAIPLSGNGYRTTLGSENGKFGCKAYTYTSNAPATDIPMMAIGFGNNPYELFSKLYSAGLKMMGKSENMRLKKTYPEPLEYIGWCTWNSSELGKNLDEQHLLAGAATFTDAKFPLGWLLIDDGWFDQDGSRLNAFTPNPAKFPNGFKSLTSKLKSQYGLKYVGIWHAYDGYWNGINADSKLGQRYKNELFNWTQNERVEVPSKPVTYSFIKPESDSLKAFYETWHKYLVNEGFDFIKVDNQLVTERMSVDTYPIWTIAEKMHQALYASTFKNFNGAIINCMDMTNDAFYNFGKSAVARTVEDYFPERDGGVGYKLEKGGPAAHVLMALYNSLYFSQMVYTDFDMFESNNTYGSFHAAARAISGGPVYVTDLPGKQNFSVLWPLIDANGRIIRADRPAMLTEDCLFQLQDKKPLKAFSFAGNSGLMAVFNAADADQVEGTVSPSEIDGLKGESFAVYEFYSQDLTVLKKNESKKITLNRMGNKYFNFVPIENGIALIGLVNKYNAPKTIVHSKIGKDKIEVQLVEGGIFKAILQSKPVLVMVNNIPIKDYSYENGILTATVVSERTKEPIVQITF